MKQVSKLFGVVFLITIISYSTSAQSFGSRSKSIFGVKLGLNIANQTFSNDAGLDDDEYETLTGFHLGITNEQYFGRVFSVETSVLYSTKGHKYIDNFESGFGIYNQDNKRTIHYLEIPVLMKASHQFGDDALGFFAAGPYLSYAIGGKWAFYEKLDDEVVVNETIDLEFGKDSDDVYRTSDWGLQMNLGVEKGPFQLSAGYQIGISNIDGARAEGAKHTNRVIKLTLGFRFMK